MSPRSASGRAVAEQLRASLRESLTSPLAADVLADAAAQAEAEAEIDANTADMQVSPDYELRARRGRRASTPAALSQREQAAHFSHVQRRRSALHAHAQTPFGR